MKRILAVFLLAGCLFSTALVSFAQRTGQRTVAPKPAVSQTRVDLGKLENNTYTNDFFALKIEFPFGWLVGDHTLEAQLTDIQKSQIKAANPKNQAAMNAALKRTTPLLGGYRALPGTPENSNLRIVVEDLRTTPQIKTDVNYLDQLLASLKKISLSPDFKVSGIETETIGDVPLKYVEAIYGTSKKRVYVMLRKNYVVLISLESYADADFDALHEVLTEAELSYKK